MNHSPIRFGSARAGAVRTAWACGLLLASAAPVLAQGTINWPDSTPVGAPATRTCFSENVRVTGYLMPRRETYVTMNMEGFRVSDVLVQEGDAVSTDQELIRLTRVDEPGAAPPAGRPPAQGAQQAPPRTISLRAPAAGVVSRSTARIGMLTRAQGEPLMRVAIEPELEALVEVPSLYATKVRSGAPARVLVDNTIDVAGVVRVPATDIDPGTQFGRARLAMTSNPALRAGMFVRALIDTGRSCGVAVPRTALLRQNDASSVQVLKDGKVETRRVRVGLSSDDKVEIREGVAEGETVVTNAGFSF